VSDDNDDDFEHGLPKMPDLKKQTVDATGAMMEMMAPMMAGAQFIHDEAQAWDKYFVAFIRTPSIMAVQTTESNVEVLAAAFADKALAARRDRFNMTTMGESLRTMLPSAQGQCGKPIVKNDGTDTGYKCTRNAGHGPPCY
jgi:hypothetical protein